MRVARVVLLSLAVAGAPVAGLAADIPESWDTSETDWTGFYAGVIAGAWYDFSSSSAAWSGMGLVGFNVQVADQLIVGAELDVGAHQFEGDPVSINGMLLGRAGFLASEEILLYGTVGLEASLDDVPGYVLGGGIEYALADDFSIRGQVLTWTPLGDSPALDNVNTSVGFVWQFD